MRSASQIMLGFTLPPGQGGLNLDRRVAFDECGGITLPAEVAQIVSGQIPFVVTGSFGGKQIFRLVNGASISISRLALSDCSARL